MNRDWLLGPISRWQEQFQPTYIHPNYISPARWNYYYKHWECRWQYPPVNKFVPVGSPNKRFNRTDPCRYQHMARRYNTYESKIHNLPIPTLTGGISRKEKKQICNEAGANRYPALSQAPFGNPKARLESPNNGSSNELPDKKRLPSRDRTQSEDKNLGINKENIVSKAQPSPRADSVEKSENEAQTNAASNPQIADQLINNPPIIRSSRSAPNANDRNRQALNRQSTPKRHLKRTRETPTSDPGETDSKLKTVAKQSCFVSIENLNLHNGRTYLPGCCTRLTRTVDVDKPRNSSKQSRPKLIKNRRNRSKSLCGASRAPRSRLRSKSLPHLPQLEAFSCLNLDDCVRDVKSWPIVQLPRLPKPPASSRENLSQGIGNTTIKKGKKTRRACILDSSDEEVERSSPKKARRCEKRTQHEKGLDNSKSSKPQKKPTFSASPLIYHPQTKSGVSRKQMLILLFGEDSENEEEEPRQASTAPKPSTNKSHYNEPKQRSKHKNNSQCNRKRREDDPGTEKKVTEKKDKSCSRKLILTDLFLDPSEILNKVPKNEPKKHTAKLPKPVSRQNSKQEPKQRKKISLPSNNMEFPKTTSKGSSSKPLVARHEELLLKFQTCPTLALEIPTKQQAKIINEEDHCTETCHINEALHVQVAPTVLKNEVVFKEEIVDYSYETLPKSEDIQRDNEELKFEAARTFSFQGSLERDFEELDIKPIIIAPGFGVISWRGPFRASLEEECFMEFQSAPPFTSAPRPAREKANVSIEDNQCTERCHVSKGARVKDDSRLVNGAADMDEGVITLYSCADTDDEVQIVSVTMPASSLNIKRHKSGGGKEKPAPSSNAVSFVVNLNSMGTAIINSGSVLTEPTQPAHPTLAQRMPNMKKTMCTSSSPDQAAATENTLQDLESRLASPEVAPQLNRVPDFLQPTQCNPVSAHILSNESPTVPNCVSEQLLPIAGNSALPTSDRTIANILFNHVYFLINLFEAQKAYLECLQGRRYCKSYFQCEEQWFELDKNHRIQMQSVKLRTELLKLSIRTSRNLPATAEGIVHYLTEQLIKTDTPKRVTKSVVYLFLWTLMSGQADHYATIPLLKLILRNSNMVFDRLNTKCSTPFTQTMRQTLISQIHQYNRLVKSVCNTANFSIVPGRQKLPVLSRSANQTATNANSLQNSASFNAMPSRPKVITPNSGPISSPGVYNHRVSPARLWNQKSAPSSTTNTILHYQQRGSVVPTRNQCGSNQSSHSSPRRLHAESLINDNFKIRLPYSRPITSVVSCSRPVISMTPTTPGGGESTGTIGCQSQQSPVLNQGINALASIGHASVMLACNRTDGGSAKVTENTPSSPSVSLQLDQSASFPALRETGNKPLESTISEEARSGCSNATHSEEVETIDLTWLDDIDETELKEEMDYVGVTQEASEEYLQRAVIEGEEDVIYTVVYDTNMCICDETPKYSCKCGQAWYCGRDCQLKDWNSHRDICHFVY